MRKLPIQLLIKKYKIENKKRDPFRVLVSTVLSQRTRDANTDRASMRLFAVYRTAVQLSQAPLRSIERLIKPAGFYRQKARRIKEISGIILKKYKGKVPAGMDELLALPGVGRKTAGCVLVFAFDVPAIPVDTHVHRVSNRLGIVATKTPEQTEKALMQIIPKSQWKHVNIAMVRHGQQLCRPRNPLCAGCFLKNMCSYGRYV